MITDCENILDIRIDSIALSYYAKKIIEFPIFKKIIDRKERLVKIARANNESAFSNNNNHSLRTSFEKFKYHYYNNNEVEFTYKDLKNLSFGVGYKTPDQKSIYENLEELHILLRILNSNWRDIYILGLFHFLLKNWDDSDNFKLLNLFLIKKINDYSGNRKILLGIKQKSKYFQGSNGDILLGADLASLNWELRKAALYINLPENWITYKYFSKVINTYFEKSKLNLQSIIGDLDETLIAHSHSITNKRTVSGMIVYAHSINDEDLKLKVKSMAFKHIGDPEINIKWNFLEGTEIEKATIKEAQQILNGWIIEQFISVFFEKCINDSRRKEFWLDYTNHITEFRVVGGRNVKRILKEDNRLKDLVDARFINTINQSSQNSAIVLKIRNHILVEFSDSGSFYAYRSTNPKAPDFTARNINSIHQLKDTNMPTLFYRQGNYVHSLRVEGKKSHSDGYLDWETALTYWINNKVME